MIDELYKIFQYIDKDSQGHLSIENLTAFQQDVAVRENARVNKTDLNLIIAALLTNAV